jgi:hypothetical protein
VYFQPAEFREFYSGYSATPGGELYVMPGERSVPVRVCLCGHPMPTRTPLAREIRQSFGDSLAKALGFRARCEPEALQEYFGNKYASRKKLEQLREELRKLQQIVIDRQEPLVLAGAGKRTATESKSGSGGSNAIRAGAKQKPAKPKGEVR